LTYADTLEAGSALPFTLAANHACHPIGEKNMATSSTPYKKGNFIASQRSLDGEVDKEYRTRAESDSYTHYVLKTGKYRGKILKQVNEEGDLGYLRWMLMDPKGCKNSSYDHIVKKGILHWELVITNRVTVNPSATGGTVSSKSNESSANSKFTRFCDTRGQAIWITGFDIQGLFHMKEAQLTRAGIRSFSNTSFGPSKF
jgi:hypothetical protein